MPTPTPTPTPIPPTPTPTPKPSFTVNSIGDSGDGNPGDGVCTDGTGNCTLRAAIEEANATPDTDIIGFNIPGVGPHTIQPRSVLPAITDLVVIDGYTQPGASPNTNGPGLGSNAVLMIELDGIFTGSPANGLHITAGGSLIRGLALYHFIVGNNAILLETNGGNIIEGNFIGTDATGTVVPVAPNYIGVQISSSDNTVGGTTPGARNIISGNQGAGIEISGDQNRVLGNLIGTDVTGTVVLRNSSRGVEVSGSNNMIGGNTPEARNIISGNGNGVEISGNQNQVLGNFIGTDVTGASTLGNGSGVGVSGSNNTIGGNTPEARNVISGNDNIGVGISGNQNQVQGNFIGTDVTGADALGNRSRGVDVGGSGNAIGGTTPEARNVISANHSVGIELSGSENQVLGNFIGTDVTGTVPLRNRSFGVIAGGSDNTVGGTTPEVRNVISGNKIGIEISGRNIQVLGNFIGTDVTGTVALGNRVQGVVASGSGNTVGGTTSTARNVISGNSVGVEISTQQIGVTIFGGESNRVLGNFIGTDVTGTLALGNRSSGVFIGSGANGNTIGGSTPATRNVVSGNDIGVEISGDRNRVLGNFIGTDVTGTVALGNRSHGADMSGSNNIIGGTTAATRNVISGNSIDGVNISGTSATGNQVLGNFIGTDVTGTVPLGNGANGVSVASSAGGNTIGRTVAGAGNLITSNGGNGVFVLKSPGNSILSNSIFSNDGLGIELGSDGVNPNDPGDADTGANNLQNFPVLTSVTIFSGAIQGTQIEGTINSTPFVALRLEFFINSACDPSGNGEGETFLGFTDWSTGSGEALFRAFFETTLAEGDLITATATDVDSNSTSEFSLCYTP